MDVTMKFASSSTSTTKDNRASRSRSPALKRKESRTYFGERECYNFLKDPSVHPITEEKLSIGSQEYNDIIRKCSYILKKNNLAEEIFIRAITLQTPTAERLCLDIVDSANPNQEVYNRVTDKWYSIQDIFTKDVLDICHKKHNVVFLHIYVYDRSNNSNIFIPVILSKDHTAVRKFMIYNFDQVHKIIYDTVEDWTKRQPNIDSAALINLFMAVSKILGVANVVQSGTKEYAMIKKLLENIQHLIRAVTHGSNDTKVTERVKTKLVSKAKTAREKTMTKRVYDQLCDATPSLLQRTDTTLLFTDYLEGYKKGSLDFTPTEYYEMMKGHAGFNLTFQGVKHSRYILLDDKHKDVEIDKDWLNEQHEYLKTLTREELFNVYGYTRNGDVFVNNFMRGTLDDAFFRIYLDTFKDDEDKYFPLFFPALDALSVNVTKIQEIYEKVLIDPLNVVNQKKLVQLRRRTTKNTTKYLLLLSILKDTKVEWWHHVIRMYSHSLEAIIRKAPPTKKKMYIYRGVKTDFYLDKFKNERNPIFPSRGFVSTSSSINVAYDFTTKDNYVKKENDILGIQDNSRHCCFMRITVLPGTRMLLTAGMSYFHHEAEFLLSRDTVFYIVKSSTEKFCTSQSGYLKMRVSDMVII